MQEPGSLTSFRDDITIGAVIKGAQNESAIIATMDEPLPNIHVPAEAFMEVSSSTSGARRDEDIALDLMKFIAMATSYGKTTSAGVGFQGSGAAAKPEEYAGHLIELYGRCLQAVSKK